MKSVGRISKSDNTTFGYHGTLFGHKLVFFIDTAGMQVMEVEAKDSDTINKLVERKDADATVRPVVPKKKMDKNTINLL